jgi:titin
MQRKVIRIAAVAALAMVGLFWASPAFAYGPTGPSLGTNINVVNTTTGGASITISGSNYQPGETVTLVLFSTPVTLGTSGPTDATGSFSMPVTIPTGTPLGAHTIVGTGNAIGDSASTAITVVSASAGTAAVITPSSGTSGGSLAFTGSDIAALTGVGAISLALGGMLVFAGRRRRATSSHS